ncbi:MAG: methyltransferase domain-containing protein [Elusimicrobiales bacterium]|nr:methyltransferase domain-containing protein [Elusimicrobiales bacterium]
METLKSLWTDFFSGANPAYNELPEAALLKFLPAVPKGNALDVGAGLGQNAAFLARQGFAVEALEKDPEIALKCKSLADREKLGIKTITGSIEEQDLAENKYSLIIAAWVFQFIPAEQVRPVLKKLEKALAPGGFLYIGTFSTRDIGFINGKTYTESNQKNTVKRDNGLLMHYFEPGELERELAHLEDVASSSGTRKDFSHGEPHTHGFIELVRRKP